MAEKLTSRERGAASRLHREKPWLPPATPVPPVPELPPQAEWLSLMEAERGDRDVGDTLAELLDRVMDECYQAHVAQQCVPFAVGWARNTMTLMVQWCFLQRDEGKEDPEGDSTWQEDEEPQPPSPDPWAEGTIPVGTASDLCVRLSPGEGEVSRQDPPPRPPCPSQVPTAGSVPPVPKPSCPQPLLDQAATVARPPRGKSPRTRLPQPPAPRPRASHREAEGSGAGGVRSPRPPLPPPPRTSPVPLQPRQPPRSTGVKPQGSGPVLAVPRLGPHCWPGRCITPQVEVLGVDTEARAPPCPWGARRHGRGLDTAGSPRPPSPLPRQLGSLLGSAPLAPGVTVRWGGSVRRGARTPVHGGDEEGAPGDLPPIRPHLPFPATVPRQVTGDSGR